MCNFILAPIESRSRSSRKWLGLIAGLILLSWPCSVRSEQPFFTGLGIPVGQQLSSARGVSADGSVVVGYFDDSYSAFRWTKAGGMVFIAGGSANGASEDGAVVVGGHARGGGGSFRWTPSGTGFLGSLAGFS